MGNDKIEAHTLSRGVRLVCFFAGSAEISAGSADFFTGSAVKTLVGEERKAGKGGGKRGKGKKKTWPALFAMVKDLPLSV